MKKLKISIIIPVYNNKLTIGGVIDSVLAQTLENIELIIVDDGSTDASPRLLDELALQDSRIKVIHKPNGGVTSARLCGVAAASGDWIGFVDGDDFVEPQMFERLLNNACKYNADISHCGYQMVFPNGRVDYYYNSGRIVKQSHIQGLCDLIQGSFIEPGLWNKLFKRELFEGLADWMDRSIRINEDLLMNYYLFNKSESSIYEDVCPYHYILRKGSASKSQLNIHILTDPLRVLKIILADANDEVYEIVYARYIRQLIRMCTMSTKENVELIRTHKKNAKKELQKSLKQNRHNQIGVRLCFMAIWAAVWPSSYGLVHRAYAKLKGYDKKYNID